VTLLFGLPRYRQVAEAYITGLEARAAQGQPVKQIASVASFFLSRIDVLVDPLVDKFLESGRKPEIARRVRGQVAIASAKAAYRIYKEIFGGNRFKKLADKGARVQRLLWASTGTKDPSYSDVKYIEPIIGPQTINTVPLKTIDAYRDHGAPQLSLEQDVKEADRVLARLPELGISLDQVTQQLEDDGVKKFDQPFDQLMAAITKKSST
jgi:transaldolase